MDERGASLSEQLKEIYRHYLERPDPEFAVRLVDRLLAKYPYYTEALLFKARMLMADGRDEEAELCIERIKSIDYWNRSYIYDEGELLYRRDKAAGIKYMEEQLVKVIEDIVDGIGHFSEADYAVGVPKYLRKKLLDFGLKMFTEKRNKCVQA